MTVRAAVMDRRKFPGQPIADLEILQPFAGAAGPVVWPDPCARRYVRSNGFSASAKAFILTRKLAAMQP
jgi:hypothetical protein